jgi:chitinase
MEPGGTATGAAPGTHEQGIENYRVLRARCPANGTVAGTAYAAATTSGGATTRRPPSAGKTAYRDEKHLDGTFF